MAFKMKSPFDKKRLEWRDSDAPEAKGKFKELSADKLANWLMKTRNNNLQKIVGSLNQQIGFNKDKPSYVSKMKQVRNKVVKKLKKK